MRVVLHFQVREKRTGTFTRRTFSPGFSQRHGGQSPLSVSDISHLPSAENNPYAKVVCFGMAYFWSPVTLKCFLAFCLITQTGSNNCWNLSDVPFGDASLIFSSSFLISEFTAQVHASEMKIIFADLAQVLAQTCLTGKVNPSLFFPLPSRGSLLFPRGEKMSWLSVEGVLLFSAIV